MRLAIIYFAHRELHSNFRQIIEKVRPQITMLTLLQDRLTAKSALIYLGESMKFLQKAFLYAVLVATAGLARADVSEATFTPQGATRFSPVEEREVAIYVVKPDFKFRLIGVIEARGMAQGDNSILGIVDGAVDQLLGNRPTQPGEKEDIALAMRALRKEAAENGALGLVLIRSVQVRVSQQATERRIVAAAIRPE